MLPLAVVLRRDTADACPALVAPHRPRWRSASASARPSCHGCCPHDRVRPANHAVGRLEAAILLPPGRNPRTRHAGTPPAPGTSVSGPAPAELAIAPGRCDGKPSRRDTQTHGPLGPTARGACVCIYVASSSMFNLISRSLVFQLNLESICVFSSVCR